MEHKPEGSPPTTHHHNAKFREFFQFRCSFRWAGAGLAVGALAAAAARWEPLRLPTIALLGTVGAVGATYSTVVEPRCPVLERVTVRLPSLPPALDGLRIGQMGDMHLGFPHGHVNTQWAVNAMRMEQPDVLVLTGDFVSFTHTIPDLPDLFRSLTAPLGVYAVPGNHDHWEGLNAIRSHLEPLGITFLMNENRCLRWHGGELWLAGIDDMWYGIPDIETALAGVPDGACTVLLSHAPDFADTARQYGVALQLSGHTHGGHLHLPLLGWFCVPFHGIRYISGLEQVGDMQLYVTRGLGGAPLRMNCPPEATIITLRCG